MIYYGYHHSFHYQHQRRLLFRHHHQIIVGRRRDYQDHQGQGQKLNIQQYIFVYVFVLRCYHMYLVQVYYH